MKKLLKYEFDYIGFLGEFFELNYLSKNEGMVFGVIVLRALTPETGLSQEEITKLVGKSKTTISRTLESLVKLGFCKYILEESEITSQTQHGEKKLGRAKRRYYFNSSFREISETSLEKHLQELNKIKTKLKRFNERIPASETQEHQNLLQSSEHFKVSLEKWIEAYRKMKDIFQKY